ncbi:DUF6095 family protein [Muricauda sp. 2012CJ35-5]|uniref:DUF6095 family protein n=1 Tax=Flagellimonas spongiicola TaxID=2942208 RepID=A0ABT0PNT9_9FLAO|nr:DUF6095 family protein [Allomuricauda spongiicola]MCL6273049.1 DUF6095 family protein [Allomuricauda spongiicola]
MKHTNKDLLVKGIKSFLLTAFFMFLAPATFYQAIKNEEHPFFLPVLILSLFFGALAIYLGFRSVKIMLDAIFGKETKS